MVELFAFLASAILLGLAMFQLSLALGAPLGKYAWGGAHTVLPSNLRLASMISIVIYGIFIAVILGDAGIINIGDSTSSVGVWILTAYFSLGTIMNAISRSKRERAVMTPTALILALLCFYIAVV